MPLEIIRILKEGRISKATPYSKGITVKLLKEDTLQNSLTQMAKMQSYFSIADRTGGILVTLTNQTKHGRIIEEKTFIISHFFVTPIMNKAKIEIPNAIMQSAYEIIMPQSPIKKVSERKTSALRSICSVKGLIIKVIL